MFYFDYASGNNNNWNSEVKHIFTCGSYETKHTVDINALRHKLFLFYAESWPDKVRNSQKLRTYIQFKTSLRKIEPSKERTSAV